MIDPPRPRSLSIIFRIHVLLKADIPLRQVEYVGVRIMRAVGGIGPNWRTLERRQFGIEFLHSRDCIVDVIHFDAKMVEATGPTVPSWNMGHTDIAIAE